MLAAQVRGTPLPPSPRPRAGYEPVCGITRTFRSATRTSKAAALERMVHAAAMRTMGTAAVGTAAAGGQLVGEASRLGAFPSEPLARAEAMRAEYLGMIQFEGTPGCLGRARLRKARRHQARPSQPWAAANGQFVGARQRLGRLQRPRGRKHPPRRRGPRELPLTSVRRTIVVKLRGVV